MPLRLISLSLTLSLSVSVVFADPLSGLWMLNLKRSHYGGGAEPRIQETFTCRMDTGVLNCTIESIMADGRKLVGNFTASYDGKPHPATGIPDVDQVTLLKQDEFIADATFSYQGKPVIGYRAVRSDDGHSLTFVSVDPTTRVVRSSVVVYERK